MTITTLIFDYFGVIRPTHRVRQTYADLGGNAVADEAFIQDTITAGNYGMVDADHVFADKLGVSVDVWKQAMAGKPYNDQQLLAYILELRARGFKTALLSNANSDALQTFFEPGEQERYFDAMLVSGDVGYAKPQPEIFRMMVEKLGVLPEQCVMIDDQVPNCEGAQMVGMQALPYTIFEHLKTDLEKLLAQAS